MKNKPQATSPWKIGITIYNYLQHLFTGLKITLAAALLITCVSCAGLRSTVQKSEMDAVDQGMDLPEGNITAYDDALQKLGVMLTAYYKPSVKVYCRPIVNATASQKLPADVSQLTQTAISKIGPKLQSIDFDSQQLSVDLALDERTMQRIVPDLAVKGAITEYDKKMEKNREIEGDALPSISGHEIDVGGSVDSSAEAATVAMDYQLLDYKTQMTIPYVQAANRMNLYSTTKAADFGLAVEGSGFGLNCKVKRSQGIHAGLRLLVELNILEVVGKYHVVPYWRCLPDGQVDERLVKRFVQELKQDPDALGTMKKLAYAHGCAIDLTSGGISADELQLLRGLKQQYGLDPDGENDYEFIKLMWMNLPIEQAAVRMANLPDPEALRRAAAEAGQRAQAEAATAAEAEARSKAESEKTKKRTTFKFGAQDSF